MSQVPPPIVPVAQLAYLPPSQYRRPGIVTAMGIISIVIAGLSGLSSLSGVVSSAMFLFIANTPMRVRTVPAAPTTMTMATTTVSGVTAYSYSVATSTTSPSTATTVPFPFNISRNVSILTIWESLASLGVAALLLIAGIRSLRDSPKTIRMHWIYVALKIPLVIVAAVGMWFTYTGMMSGLSAFSASTGAAPPPIFSGAIMVVPVVFSALIAMAYPIALIFILQSRAVRTHFSVVRGS